MFTRFAVFPQLFRIFLPAETPGGRCRCPRALQSVAGVQILLEKVFSKFHDLEKKFTAVGLGRESADQMSMCRRSDGTWD